MTPQDLWAAYRPTCFTAPEPLAFSRFAILTAWNPGVFLGKTENQLRQAELGKQLEAEGLPHTLIWAGAPDWSHFEPSYAVATALPECEEVAKRWGQNALFWVEDGGLWLVGCQPTFPPSEEVGRFSQRWRSWTQLSAAQQAEFRQSIV